jgi:hypothetical protein
MTRSVAPITDREAPPARAAPRRAASVIPPETLSFYRTVLDGLLERDIPFLIGGAYAMAHHARIERHTRDLDLFVMRETLPAIEQAARELGFTAEEFSPHWLWKITTEVGYVDLIWSSGNGAAPVDHGWFVHSVPSHVFGIPVRLIPAEEMIWSKAYIQERERFDGADIAHILLESAERLDWERVLERFGPHWRVLLEHLIAFGFIYPSQRHSIPPFVMRELISRLQDETAPARAGESAPASADEEPEDGLCGGTLLSRLQYLIDVRERGWRDARLEPAGAMTQEQIDEWSRRAEVEAAASMPAPPPSRPRSTTNRSRPRTRRSS